MNSDVDLLREEPPAYGGAAKPSPAPTRQRRVKAAHRRALKQAPAKLHWNTLHVMGRQEICFGANVSEKMANKSWEELDRWLQVHLEFSVESRWKGRIQLCG
jgi:hypothetical protein